MRVAAHALGIVACCLVCAGLAQAAGLETEFLGKAWGTPLSEFKGLAGVGGEGKVAYYVNPRQAYTVFDTPVAELVYGFYDERFFAVYVNIKGIDTFSTIKGRIQQRYGLPKISMEARGTLTTYSWKAGESRVKLKHAEASGAMKLSFYHTPIADLANAELRRELGDEPPEPIFPLSRVRQREALELLDLSNF
jgi:hypothetical protein